MRFEFYHSGLDQIPKLSVDGTVPNAIHFSHWQGNETPAEVKADTSTEIALKLAASPHRQALTQGIELVTNNHFDTDGVLSVWTVLTGPPALELSDQLTSAAEAGDFSEFPNEAAVRASIVIQGSDQVAPADDGGSPLARQLAGRPVDDARAYELVLPEIERVLTHTNDYELLWRAGWETIAIAMESFESGGSTVTEFANGLSLITLAPEVYSSSGFDPTRNAAPYTAISRYAHGTIYVIATPVKQGWSYRIDYPYYSWAETVVRPRIPRRDLEPLISELNEIEGNRNGQWKADASEMTSAVKFVGGDGVPAASGLAPDKVANVFGARVLAKRPSAAVA
jgi:hypothetical protein